VKRKVKEKSLTHLDTFEIGLFTTQETVSVLILINSVCRTQMGVLILYLAKFLDIQKEQF